MSTLVRLRGVAVLRGSTRALDRIDVELPAHGVVAVLGGNGAGKSTLLELLAGIARPSTGSLEWAAGSPPPTALVVQRSEADDRLPLTVEDVVAMGRWAALGLWRPLRRADRAAVAQAIDRLGLGELRRRRLGELSGGQRQRALLGQALVRRARLLLLDEPDAGLDAASREVLGRVLREAAGEGAAVVLATHDRRAARDADHRIHLVEGRIRDVENPLATAARSLPWHDADRREEPSRSASR
ncbi:zinc ABC transporter ATP-binding protein AztA [Homoserinibacter sp. YIM 151385]|uniref:zinc ABC transporter ATP-binding protein AztA n=1 Tax=Homoserinibacter sp. YIM 151385 TaxID=2985506 RepID=UPI0022F0553C|nr:zinc ABC transporter ATP-binding protein AztA [Homoserinibacter sp. YIM 151385]WBU38072.1 zinc ABC transporter ATP-binding protein AztA [Homoserinibacter sp. YIM 151385]